MSAESINVAGVISIIVFYLVVLAIGLWAGWRQRKVARQQGRSNTDQEEVMLAGRDIGLFVGILTMGGMLGTAYTEYAILSQVYIELHI